MKRRGCVASYMANRLDCESTSSSAFPSQCSDRLSSLGDKVCSLFTALLPIQKTSPGVPLPPAARVDVVTSDVSVSWTILEDHLAASPQCPRGTDKCVTALLSRYVTGGAIVSNSQSRQDEVLFFSSSIQHSCRLVGACLAFVRATRIKMAVNVKYPTSTFR